MGQKTVGKNVASVTLSDPKKRFRWGLQPIVSKCFNSLNQSDFTAGFQPDYVQGEGSVLYPYGDDRDPLLATALGVITPPAALARQISGLPGQAETEIDNSVRRKAGGGNTFLNISW